MFLHRIGNPILYLSRLGRTILRRKVASRLRTILLIASAFGSMMNRRRNRLNLLYCARRIA